MTPARALPRSSAANAAERCDSAERVLTLPVAQPPEPVLYPGRFPGLRCCGGEPPGWPVPPRSRPSTVCTSPTRGEQPDPVRVAERQRRAQVVRCLRVGEHRPRLLCGAPVGGSSRRLAAGELQVPCDRRGRDARHLRGPAVQQPPAGQAGLLVDQGPQLLVAEVVVPRSRRATLAHQPAPHHLLQRASRSPRRSPADSPDRADVEAAPDDRRRGQQLARGLADRVQPGQQQLAGTGRQRPGLAPRPACAGTPPAAAARPRSSPTAAAARRGPPGRAGRRCTSSTTSRGRAGRGRRRPRTRRARLPRPTCASGGRTAYARRAPRAPAPR